MNGFEVKVDHIFNNLILRLHTQIHWFLNDKFAPYPSSMLCYFPLDCIKKIEKLKRRVWTTGGDLTQMCVESCAEFTLNES